jgi:hypothetical protein
VTLSEGRLSHLAHVIQKVLTAEGLAKVTNERMFLNAVKETLTGTLSLDDRLDQLVRTRMPRHALPGSREWDVIYRKLYEEERRKIGDR